MALALAFQGNPGAILLGLIASALGFLGLILIVWGIHVFMRSAVGAMMFLESEPVMASPAPPAKAKYGTGFYFVPPKSRSEAGERE